MTTIERAIHSANARKGTHQYKRIKPSDQAENPFAQLVPNQDIAIIPSFRFESGVILHNLPVAYTTYGHLAPTGDNAVVICHACTGSADVKDWWAPLLDRTFDLSRFFVVCCNSLGSPYGSASPVTAKDGDLESGHYGPTFPLTTIRDDVRVFKLLLDDLGVTQIATVIGGSMGGMLVLEFAYFGRHYVRTIVPIATSARYSAWGISWGEAQRQSIYSDRKYDDGYYAFNDPPATGLGAARMSALLTYRSWDSFETRFGRKQVRVDDGSSGSQRPQTPPEIEENSAQHFYNHNEGHRNAGTPRKCSSGKTSTTNSPVDSPLHQPQADRYMITVRDPQFMGDKEILVDAMDTSTSINRSSTGRRCYSAQSYLRYQGEKFVKRFDANCYIAITRKLDTHDVARDRTDTATAALAMIEQPALVLGIPSDGLFTYQESEQLAAGIPNAELRTVISQDGHDGFLLEFEQISGFVKAFLQRELADLLARVPVVEFSHENNEREAPELEEEQQQRGMEVKAGKPFRETEPRHVTARCRNALLSVF